jgi:pilus assembly protein Flp/PilA
MMNTLTHLMLQLKNDRRGVTALEYGLIASLIAVVIIVGVTAVGTNAAATFTAISNHL